MWHIEKQCLCTPELKVGQIVLLTYPSVNPDEYAVAVEATIIGFDNGSTTDADVLLHCPAVNGNLYNANSFSIKSRKIFSKLSLEEKKHLVWYSSKKLTLKKDISILVAELDKELK